MPRGMQAGVGWSYCWVVRVVTFYKDSTVWPEGRGINSTYRVATPSENFYAAYLDSQFEWKGRYPVVCDGRYNGTASFR